ncbi:MAG: DUF4286 family protein [Edaphocola sp.]
MIIYNITAKVASPEAERWLQWMRNVHIPEMMRTGLFGEYRLCRLLEQDDGDGDTFVVQYHCDSAEHYGTYQKEHATLMRKKQMDNFGTAYVAFHTAMEILV